jgi:hypothetical protein
MALSQALSKLMKSSRVAWLLTKIYLIFGSLAGYTYLKI